MIFSFVVFSLHGGNLVKEILSDQSTKVDAKDGINLPSLSGGLESTLSEGKSFPVSGTNVLRVPFGVRQPRKQRPNNPERLATLVLPFQSLGGSPTPPPHAA